MGFSRQEYWSGLPLPSPSTVVCIFKDLCISECAQFEPVFRGQLYLVSLFYKKKQEHQRAGQVMVLTGVGVKANSKLWMD